MGTRQTNPALPMLNSYVYISSAGVPEFSIGREPDELSGLVAWFRSDSFITSSGGEVTTWGDKSSESHDLTPVGDGSYITFQSSNSAFNNHPTINFKTQYAGSNPFNVTKAVLASSASSALSQSQTGYSIYCVAQWAPFYFAEANGSSFPNRSCLAVGDDISDRVIMRNGGAFGPEPGEESYYVNSDELNHLISNNQATSATPNDSAPTGDVHLFALHYNSAPNSPVIAEINGMAYTASVGFDPNTISNYLFASGSRVSLGGFVSGSSATLGFSGSIAEAIVFNRKLDEAGSREIRQYIYQRYGIVGA